jgi:hypothetical protein
VQDVPPNAWLTEEVTRALALLKRAKLGYDAAKESSSVWEAVEKNARERLQHIDLLNTCSARPLTVTDLESEIQEATGNLSIYEEELRAAEMTVASQLTAVVDAALNPYRDNQRPLAGLDLTELLTQLGVVPEALSTATQSIRTADAVGQLHELELNAVVNENTVNLTVC